MVETKSPSGFIRHGMPAGRLAWLVGLRVVFLTLTVGLTFFFYLRSGFRLGSYSNRVLLVVFVVGYASAAAEWVALRRKQHVAHTAYFELVFEQALWTALIYVTGGAASGATAFYGLTCVAGAVLLGPRGVMVAAGAGATLYVLLCIAFVTGVVGVPSDQPRPSYLTNIGQVVYPFFLNALVLMIVTVLAQYLAERLRLTRGRLEEVTARAEHAERLAVLGRISAALAHEIRNPLSSIAGSVQLLRDTPGLDVDGRQLCTIIERETGRLNDLVGDMLQLARPKPPVFTPVDVGRTVREVVALACQSGRGSDVTVEYHGPDGTEPLMTRADAAQLRQVVWNLVRNAVQASSPGATVSVRVEPMPPYAGRTDSEWSIAVHDHGPGINPDAMSRLFDPFFTTRSAGVGIGLAVVKRIVDDHGWNIDIESGAGRGATFRVRASGNYPRMKSERPR